MKIEQVTASSQTLQNIIAIETRVLGYRRPTDLEFFMKHQPAYLFRRNGELVGYAFGCDGNSAGPAAARHAVNWALSSGYRIDPFYEVLLAKESSMKLDRYVITQSAFLW